MNRIITTEPGAGTVYVWRCPTCGIRGRSKNRHCAVVRLRAHWRNCPDARAS